MKTNSKNIGKIGGNTAIVLLFVLFAVATIGLLSTEFKTVKGGELGVMETWSDGVVDNVYQPKNYVLWPRWSKEIYTYDSTLLTHELVDYVIKSSDNQEMTVKSRVQWRRDPSKLVHHHRTFKNNAEKVAIEPAMISAILRRGTVHKAIEAYSGDGLVKMQSEIQTDLMENSQLKADGIIIESYIIEYNHLKPDFLEEINKRQLATLRQSRAIEEQKAAEADALVAKSKAQADLNTKVVEAERDQQVKIIAAKAQAEQVVLQVEAEKKKLIAEAEGKKQASISEAEGLLALGKAKAEAQKLQLQAYAVTGADAYVKTKVAENLANAFQNVKGYLPSDLKISVLAGDFAKAVDAATGNIIVPVGTNTVSK